jgi:hypothetical protein
MPVLSFVTLQEINVIMLDRSYVIIKSCALFIILNKPLVLREGYLFEI